VSMRVCESVRGCVRVCVYVCVRVCVYMCVLAYVCVVVGMCVRACRVCLVCWFGAYFACLALPDVHVYSVRALLGFELRQR
jgi:hypothetical protein